ncbi:MAG: heme exporter protein CcmD [Gammaproteobacteria bacterium]|nr:heme exporter protein CcmD [Gammaproteobacteria bacterium]
MREFLLMDGYWAYVWSAWGLTLAVLLALVYSARRHHRQALRQAAEQDEAPRPVRAAVKELS